MSEFHPCLYMLWPSAKKEVQESIVQTGYNLRTYQATDDQNVVDLLMSDGESMSKHDWQHYVDSLLPNGLFVVEDRNDALVATAGAVHNPNPGRYYFPFGGELGYLIVREEHRRQGLGRAVCQAVVKRLLSAGYENIRVCVKEYREPAIRTYLSLGFEPFLHSAEVEQRWNRLCERLGLPAPALNL